MKTISQAAAIREAHELDGETDLSCRREILESHQMAAQWEIANPELMDDLEKAYGACKRKGFRRPSPEFDALDDVIERMGKAGAKRRMFGLWSVNDGNAWLKIIKHCAE